MKKTFLLPVILILGFFSCDKPGDDNPPPTPAALTSTAISIITQYTAQGGGNISSDGGNAITARGVCWSINPNPSTADSKTTDGTGKGSFSSSLTGLTANTTYYARAYATNSAGTAYGNEISFKTEAMVVMPVLTTTALTAITPTTAQSGGNITVGDAITARGICWNTTTNPTIAGSKTIDGTDAGTFTSFSTGLASSTTYYIRAYATNSAGTAYGNEMSFTTLSAVANKVYDIDGNFYNTITIGTQVWMLENLQTTRYRNGKDITNAVADAAWSSNTDGAYSIYANSSPNNNVYGKLYNWYAVADAQHIAPEGWHVPTVVEWQTLIDFLGGFGYAGGAIMEAGVAHWTGPNSATNSSGFTGLPGGDRSDNGEYVSIGRAAYWWTATESGPGNINAETRALYDGDGAVIPISAAKGFGFSVRCVKD